MNGGFKGMEAAVIGDANKAVSKRMDKFQKTVNHLTGFDFSNENIKNSQAKGIETAYKKQGETEINRKKEKSKDVYIDESKMMTGDPWFDIGLAMGRKRKEKLANK